MPRINGSNFADFIDLSAAVISDDVIFANNGNDVILAGFGDDFIKGGGGADTINGGRGTDTADYTDSTVGVVIDLMAGRGFYGTAAGDTLFSIENVNGSAYDDILAGGLGDGSTLHGLNGNDILIGNGLGTLNHLHGDNGNDILKGGGGSDFMFGGSGIDTASYSDSSAGVQIDLRTNVIFGELPSGGTDARGGDAQGDRFNSIENLVGSNHSDTLTGSSADNVIYGLDGTDTISGWDGNDTLYGGTGNDWLNGGTGNDTLYGESGHDHLLGGPHADIMDGGWGNDTYDVDNAGDVVVELAGQGFDHVHTSVDFALLEEVEVELLECGWGGASYMPLYLTGNSGSQEIIGNLGHNIINGRGGNDTLTGFGGDDVFIFNTALGPANVDIITDYNPTDDSFFIDHAIFNGLASAPTTLLLDSEFRIGAAAQDADDRIIYDSSTGAISYDSDGIGKAVAVQFASVTAGLSLTSADFYVF